MEASVPPLVVDANIVLAASLREGTTRGLLLHPSLSLYAPHHLWGELGQYAEVVCTRASIRRSILDALWSTLQDRIVRVPEVLVRRHLEEALVRLRGGDEDDAPYLAAALAVAGAIWTHDKRFRDRAGVTCYSTGDLLDALGPL